MRHRAYELMRRYPDLCLNGYLVGRYSVKNTDKQLKSPYLDEGIHLICEFIRHLGMRGGTDPTPHQPIWVQLLLETLGTDISGAIWVKSRIEKTGQQTSQQFVLLSLNLKNNYC